MYYRPSRLVRVLSPFLLLLLFQPVADLATAERPSTPRLLPHDTLAYVRVSDTKDLVTRFQETALGRIGRDPQIKPLVFRKRDSLFAQFHGIFIGIGQNLEGRLKNGIFLHNGATISSTVTAGQSA